MTKNDPKWPKNDPKWPKTMFTEKAVPQNFFFYNVWSFDLI